jgi:hypothetical protein
MTNFVRAVSTADIPAGQGKLWRHGDKRIALFRTAAMCTRRTTGACTRGTR